VSEVVSIDPFTGEQVFTAPSADAAAVSEAVGAAAAAQPAWAAREDRGAVLRAFADAVGREARRLAELLVREVGKRRADAEGEVAWTAQSARWYADHPPEEAPVGDARVLRRPIGVVAAITPWNVPLITPAWKWLPALMAGNAVVWKPSERATASAVAATELLHAAGVPADALVLVPGGHGTAAALAADERVGALHFTGSEGGGRALAELAAPRFARVALEMSGLNPAIVLADADLDLAADCIVACATALAGQKCTSTRRVLVEEAVVAPLTERLAARFAALRVGDPRDPATDVGPLIGADARARVEAEVARAVAAGAEVVASGRIVGSADPAGAGGSADPAAPAGAALFAPTLLTGLAPDDPLRRGELFAPVLSIEAVGSAAEAFAEANAASYGLSAAVYARDPALLEAAARSIRSGVLAFNRRGDDVGLEAPFGGRGRSGNGQAEGGRYVYDALTDYQTVYTG
jgi:alpha-ketoglutaric semialdehyde dehydrogenase